MSCSQLWCCVADIAGVSTQRVTGNSGSSVPRIMTGLSIPRPTISTTNSCSNGLTQHVNILLIDWHVVINLVPHLFYTDQTEGGEGEGVLSSDTS